MIKLEIKNFNMALSFGYLPYDILRVISLYCKPKDLAINKELFNMYDDTWYYDKLLRLKESTIKLYTSTNYRDLYNKYLQQGTIYRNSTIDEYIDESCFDYKLKTKGVKAAPSSDSCDYVLTFDGDLYLESDKEITLIDTEVIDIDTDTYIKYNEWYVKQNDKWNKLDVGIKTFIKTLNNDVYLITLTTSGIYYYSAEDESIFFMPIKDPINMEIYNKLFISNKLNQTFYMDYPENVSLFDIDDVILKSNNCLYNNNNQIVDPILTNNRLGFEDFKFVPIPFTDNVQNIVFYYKDIFILSNNVLFIFKRTGKKNSIDTCERLYNIKNIYHSLYLYIIKTE